MRGILLFLRQGPLPDWTIRSPTSLALETRQGLSHGKRWLERKRPSLRTFGEKVRQAAEPFGASLSVEVDHRARQAVWKGVRHPSIIVKSCIVHKTGDHRKTSCWNKSPLGVAVTSTIPFAHSFAAAGRPLDCDRLVCGQTKGGSTLTSLLLG